MVMDMISPQNSSKKQLMILVGLVTILAAAGTFKEEGFSFDLTEPVSGESYEALSSELDSDMTGLILSRAEEDYEEYFMALLNRNGIEVREVSVGLYLNEADEADISGISIVLSDGDDIETARELVKAQLPLAEPEITAEEESYEPAV